MTLRHSMLLALAVPFSLTSTLAFAQAPPAPATAQPPSNAMPSSATPGHEPTTDQRALAEMLFFTGKGMMADGRIAQACGKFAESYRLDPAAGTLLNLAVCHEKEGKIASAWGEYRQALAEARRAQRPDREQLAKDALAKLEPDLPFLVIVVPPAVRVPGMQIARNGVPLQEGAWDTELPIDPGTNEIMATAPDYKLEKKTVTLEKRQHVTVTIDPLELAPIDRPPPPFWTTKREVGAIVFGGGVALAAVGGIFGAMTLSNKSKSDDNCPVFDGEHRCNQVGADAMSSAKTDAVVSDIGIGLGAAAMVTGAVLFLTGGSSQEGGPSPVGAPPVEKQGKWDWRMNAGARGFQGVLSHSF